MLRVTWSEESLVGELVMQRSLFTGMTGFYGGTLARGVPEERPLGVRSFTNVDNPRKSFEDADNPANWRG